MSFRAVYRHVSTWSAVSIALLFVSFANLVTLSEFMDNCAQDVCKGLVLVLVEEL